MNKRIGLALLCAVLFLLSLASCTGGRGDGRLNETGVRGAETQNMHYERNEGDNNFSRQNPNIRVGDPTPRTIDAEAQRMEQAAEGIDGVEDATVIITGGNAFVRIDIARDVHRSRAPALEEEVAEHLFNLLPRYEYRVTSDERLFNRLMNR